MGNLQSAIQAFKEKPKLSPGYSAYSYQRIRTKEAVLMSQMKSEVSYHSIPHSTIQGDYSIRWFPEKHTRTVKKVTKNFLGFKKVKIEREAFYHYQCTVSGPDGDVSMCVEDYKELHYGTNKPKT